ARRTHDAAQDQHAPAGTPGTYGASGSGVSTGSLGQGLSVAQGVAMAAKLDGKSMRVYCMVGDGELQEGQVWEAIDFLRDHDLKAVCPIFNCNAFAQTQQVSPQQNWETTAKKLEAAGVPWTPGRGVPGR
ncbi:MAG: hypothetical protein HC900_08135, partial [Methylacidiphilales bacterium]|nr:hypothetical protein [Candidatus Methylacidiphilales bacterium]